MIADLALRFVLGGAIVCAFSVAGELFQPKRFAGLFGAAPSVAIATLALGFAHDGADVVRAHATWMAAATLAMLAYCVACVVLTRRAHVPVWLTAAAAWLVWLGVTAIALLALRGVLPS